MSVLRQKALKLFEEFLAQSEESEVRDFVNGRAWLGYTDRNQTLESLREMDIKDAYAFLAKPNSSALKDALAPPRLRKGSTATAVPKLKADKIDHILRLTFGKTYRPPPKPKAPRKTSRKPIDSDKVIRELSAISSPEEAKARIRPLLVPDLKAVASRLRIPVGGQRKPQLISDIVDFCIGARAEHRHYTER
ncbi:MAG TPA: hypothetical protein VF062_14940 [Candidatus Limnocylindrales bacterium]